MSSTRHFTVIIRRGRSSSSRPMLAASLIFVGTDADSRNRVRRRWSLAAEIVRHAACPVVLLRLPEVKRRAARRAEAEAPDAPGVVAGVVRAVRTGRGQASPSADRYASHASSLKHIRRTSVTAVGVVRSVSTATSPLGRRDSRRYPSRSRGRRACGRRARRPAPATRGNRTRAAPLRRNRRRAIPGRPCGSPNAPAAGTRGSPWPRRSHNHRRRRQCSSSSGPAARWIAPSTPPPPSSDELAALTMASTSCCVMSPRTRRSSAAASSRPYRCQQLLGIAHTVVRHGGSVGLSLVRRRRSTRCATTRGRCRGRPLRSAPSSARRGPAARRACGRATRRRA